MVRSSASGSVDPTATRCRAYRISTPKGEWQCVRYARGRVAVHLTLPLGGERTGWYVQVRVAVRRSLPLDIERTVLVRPGASGSAIGTLGGEWQCIPHCHSVSSVPSGSATLNLGGSRRGSRGGSRRGSQEGSRRGSQLQDNDKGRPRVLRDLPPLDHTNARQASLPCAR